MAKLEYDKTGRLMFTKEMKKEYTILMPQMLSIHFELLKNVLILNGYRVELLTSTGDNIRRQGLENVHNDTCYPALLVIGQMLDALKSGKYDLNKTALIITQTGGGCRASNYIHLLRKGLKKSGLENIPVISFNLSGFEKNSGFKITLPMIRQMAISMMYGDILMLLQNQVRPYEIVAGAAKEAVDRWVSRLSSDYEKGKGLSQKEMMENFDKIVKDFAQIPIHKVPKVKVGVVGEIYIKYAPLGNNNLERFLLSEDTEVYVPGVTDFILFKIDNRLEDSKLYGGGFLKKPAVKWLFNYVHRAQLNMIAAVKKEPKFVAPTDFLHIKSLVKDYIGYGAKMGEGWLLTAEMLELIDSDVANIVCTQPFGCLPNHVAGKGMIRKIKMTNPDANIVAIDYDPGATEVNQENRIKLMLAVARSKMEKDQQKSVSNPVSVESKV